jgi:hypothetical protein
VEKEAREAGATHEQQRLARRQQRSVAFFEELGAKITQIDRFSCSAIKQSRRSLPIRPQPVGTAEGLPSKWPHRDRSEPLQKCHAALAVGRNWLHIGSQEAGPKIAAILSVMETCKRLQINLRKCLNDVLPQLPPPDPSTTSPLSPAELEIVRVGSPQTPDLTPPALHPHTLALPTRIRALAACASDRRSQHCPTDRNRSSAAFIGLLIP